MNANKSFTDFFKHWTVVGHKAQLTKAVHWRIPVELPNAQYTCSNSTLAAKVKRQLGERHLWLCTFKLSLMKVCDTSTMCLLQQYSVLFADFLLAP